MTASERLLFDRLQGPPCETVAAATGTNEVLAQFLAAFAHPPYLPGGYAGHQGLVLDITRNYGSGGDKRRAAYRMTANDGAVGS